ncbi:MAG: hypothetical protein ACI37Z_05090 [Candidatus Gastranaerophilaceae bacterium]
MEIGDRVIVTDDGEIYSTYRDWIEHFASKYLTYWEYARDFPVNCKNMQFTIVAKHSHEETSDIVCLIQAPDEKVYLVSELGIKKVNDINISDFVSIVDKQCVYTEYENWIRDNASTYFSIWKRGSLPNNLEEFRVLTKAPKANFYPFNEIQLCLVQEQNPPYQVLIVEERGLQRK